ncbi:hypothetical protein CH35J_003563 [Colletotrichum higginsianum]|nr:hypothetical protein CH35J_003563 [Colletotrichum higginsianum]
MRMRPCQDPLLRTKATNVLGVGHWSLKQGLQRFCIPRTMQTTVHFGRVVSRVYYLTPGTSLKPLLGQQEGPQNTARISQSEPQPVHDNYKTDCARVPPLRSWLQNCDECHDCRSDSRPKRRFLPARLLNVHPSGDPGQLRLDDASTSEGNRYLALSHCWGKSTAGQSPMWRTLAANLALRMQGFTLDELPKTLQDAVWVTRGLGVLYLWVDSLCIVQDDARDWNRESKRMEDVYASAYCTIAATSAPDSSTGFLGGLPRNDGLFVESADGRAAYVSTNVADFDDDVNASGLNRRAWVMQERLLSPRTIHFTSNQVYGECGEGIYAGNGVFLRTRRGTKRYFQIDPRFPDRLRSSGFATTWEFLRSLLEDYSRRGITEPSDRAVAVSGLMARVQKALPCPVHHGIMDWYLHRSLLWHRGKADTRGKIDYKSSTVPSWSWMAYEGPVGFLPDGFGTLDRFGHVSFDRTSLTTTVWEFTEPGLRAVDVGIDSGRDHIYDSKGRSRGWITLDGDTESPFPRYLAVLARLKGVQVEERKYYVLFLQPMKSQEGEERLWQMAYERLGMGVLEGDCELRNVGQGGVF